MFIRAFADHRMGHTISVEHLGSQDKLSGPSPRSPQHKLVSQERRNCVMGNCLSLFAFIGSPKSEHVPQNHTTQTSSTEGLISRDEQMEPSPRLEDLEKDIRKGLRDLMKQSSERENSKIILPEELDTFWGPLSRRQFYTNQSWHDHTWNQSNYMAGYHKVMSILILAQFRDWANFKHIFIDKGRSDKRLLFSKEELQAEDFLGSDFAPYFWDNQWIVCPLVIKEREDPYELTGIQAERRFPYIEPGKEIGNGATGTVFKQVIATRHLIYSTPGRVSSNTQVCRVHTFDEAETKDTSPRRLHASVWLRKMSKQLNLITSNP